MGLAVPLGEAGGHSPLLGIVHLGADAQARRGGQEQQPSHSGELVTFIFADWSLSQPHHATSIVSGGGQIIESRAVFNTFFSLYPNIA